METWHENPGHARPRIHRQIRQSTSAHASGSWGVEGVGGGGGGQKHDQKAHLEEHAERTGAPTTCHWPDVVGQSSIALVMMATQTWPTLRRSARRRMESCRGSRSRMLVLLEVRPASSRYLGCLTDCRSNFFNSSHPAHESTGRPSSSCLECRESHSRSVLACSGCRQPTDAATEATPQAPASPRR